MLQAQPKTLAQVFSFKFRETFKNTLFIEHLQTTASGVLFLFHISIIIYIAFRCQVLNNL